MMRFDTHLNNQHGRESGGATASFLVALLVCFSSGAFSQEQASSLAVEIDQLASQIEQKVIAWRRDIHKYPELGNREFRTSKLVAKHLKDLGFEGEDRGCPHRSNWAFTGWIGSSVNFFLL